MLAMARLLWAANGVLSKVSFQRWNTSRSGES